MLEYEISRILHVLLPYLSNTLAVISGIIISNMFWKGRIYRYANATILKTLEYQKNKVDSLTQEIKEKNKTISDLNDCLKVAKIAALKIIGVTK